MSDREKRFCLRLLSFFQIDGKPANEVATEGQIQIFYEIVMRKNLRVQIITPTQYGKSLFVALASIVVSCIQKEMVAIVSPTSDKAKIIMRYYIKHIGDSPLFWQQLEKNTKLERLQMEESKERIVLRNGGGIYVLSAQASNSQRGIEAAMGSGAKVVVTDESSLIPDNIEATIYRMLAGYKEGFYCKIGNPFYRNHFLESWLGETYKKIFIDYKQGLREGRFTNDFIEEAKTKPHFNILFECKFPDEEMIDDKGFVRLFPDELITRCKQNTEPFGELRMGVDIAEEGGDSNVLGLRWQNIAKVLLRFKNADTMTVPGQVIQAIKQFNIIDENVFMDSIGVGKGSYDRMREQNYAVTEIKFSEKAGDEEQFLNKRAECYWMFFKWLNEGGKLEISNEWDSLRFIKYKVNSSGKIQIISKDELRREGIRSPDVIDAIAMTFSRKRIINRSTKQLNEELKLVRQFDAHRGPEGKKTFTGSAYLRHK